MSKGSRRFKAAEKLEGSPREYRTLKVYRAFRREGVRVLKEMRKYFLDTNSVRRREGYNERD